MKILILILLFSTTSFAGTSFSLGGGLNFNTVETEGAVQEFDDEISGNLAIAGKVEMEISKYWLVRTGVWLQEKSARLSTEKVADYTLEINTVYTSVPLNIKFNANEKLGFYGGYIADLRINDYCVVEGDFDKCTVNKDSESIVHVATLGVSMNLNDRLNIDVGWQHGLTDVYEDGYKLHTLQAMFFYRF